MMALVAEVTFYDIQELIFGGKQLSPTHITKSKSIIGEEREERKIQITYYAIWAFQDLGFFLPERNRGQANRRS